MPRRPGEWEKGPDGNMRRKETDGIVEPSEEPTKQKTQPTKPAKPTLKGVKDLLGMSNLAILFAGREYCLAPEEIDELAGALYEVLCLHPAVWFWMQTGGRLTVYGRLLVVIYGLSIKRVAIYNAKHPPTAVTTGPARSADRDNGQRQDGAGRGVPTSPPMGAGS